MTSSIHRVLQELYLQRGEGVISGAQLPGVPELSDGIGISDRVFMPSLVPIEETIGVVDDVQMRLSDGTSFIISEIIQMSEFIPQSQLRNQVNNNPKIEMTDKVFVNPVHSHTGSDFDIHGLTVYLIHLLQIQVL